MLNDKIFIHINCMKTQQNNIFTLDRYVSLRTSNKIFM